MVGSDGYHFGFQGGEPQEHSLDSTSQAEVLNHQDELRIRTEILLLPALSSFEALALEVEEVG